MSAPTQIPATNPQVVVRSVMPTASVVPAAIPTGLSVSLLPSPALPSPPLSAPLPSPPVLSAPLPSAPLPSSHLLPAPFPSSHVLSAPPLSSAAQTAPTTTVTAQSTMPTAQLGAPVPAVAAAGVPGAAQTPAASSVPMVMVPGIPYPVPLAMAVQLSALMQQQQQQKALQQMQQTQPAQQVGAGLAPAAQVGAAPAAARPMAAMLIQTANGPMLVSVPFGQQTQGMPQVLGQQQTGAMPQILGQQAQAGLPGMLGAQANSAITGTINPALGSLSGIRPLAAKPITQAVNLPQSSALRHVQLENASPDPLSAHALQGRQAKIMHASPRAWASLNGVSVEKNARKATKPTVIVVDSDAQRDPKKPRRVALRVAADKDLVPPGYVRLPHVQHSKPTEDSGHLTVIVDEHTPSGTEAIELSADPIRSAHSRTQFYFTPTEGTPIPVGGADQPPVTYFARGLPKRGDDQGGLGYDNVMALKTWFARHWTNPTPTDQELLHLSQLTGLSEAQVYDWIKYESRRNFPADKLAMLEPGLQPYLKAAISKAKPKSRSKKAKGASELAGDEPLASNPWGSLQPMSDSIMAAAHAGSLHLEIGSERMSDPAKTVFDLNPPERLMLATGKDCIIVKNKSTGSLGGQLILTSGGVPIDIPDGSIVSADGSILVPSASLPEGAVTQAPTVHVDSQLVWAAEVAEHAARGMNDDLDRAAAEGGLLKRAHRMEQREKLIQQRAAEDEAQAVPTKSTSKKSNFQMSTRKRRRDEISGGRSAAAENDQAAPQDPVLSWALWSMHIPGPGFPPVPDNVKPINPDGSIPPGADFVILPTASCLLVAKVCPAQDGESDPSLVPVGALSDSANPLAGTFFVGGLGDAFGDSISHHEPTPERHDHSGVIPALLGSGPRSRGDSTGSRLRAASTSSRMSELHTDAFGNPFASALGLSGDSMGGGMEESFLSSIHSAGGIPRSRERARSGSLDVLAMMTQCLSDYEEGRDNSRHQSHAEPEHTDAELRVPAHAHIHAQPARLRARTLSSDFIRGSHASQGGSHTSSPVLRGLNTNAAVDSTSMGGSVLSGAGRRDRLASMNLNLDTDMQDPLHQP